MRKILLPFLLFIVVSVPSLAQAPASDVVARDIDQLSWLLGTWKGQLGQKLYVERWYQEEDGRIHGIGNYVDGNDSTLAELLVIQPIGDKLVYLVYPIGQLPALFLFTQLGGDHFLVENPEHDFPQKIGYKVESEDEIIATVEGNGKKFNVKFERVTD